MWNDGDWDRGDESHGDMVWNDGDRDKGDGSHGDCGMGESGDEQRDESRLADSIVGITYASKDK